MNMVRSIMAAPDSPLPRLDLEVRAAMGEFPGLFSGFVGDEFSGAGAERTGLRIDQNLLSGLTG